MEIGKSESTTKRVCEGRQDQVSVKKENVARNFFIIIFSTCFLYSPLFMIEKNSTRRDLLPVANKQKREHLRNNLNISSSYYQRLDTVSWEERQKYFLQNSDKQIIFENFFLCCREKNYFFIINDGRRMWLKMKFLWNFFLDIDLFIETCELSEICKISSHNSR